MLVLMVELKVFVVWTESKFAVTGITFLEKIVITSYFEYCLFRFLYEGTVSTTEFI